jgi:hypothetical protein
MKPRPGPGKVRAHCARQGRGDARLRIVWLDDPDGVTQYVTETAESRAASAPAT